jgi:uracil-DNA glycosylase family 4
MATLVRDEGSLGARLVLIGEAPGATEDATGRPFVGAAGIKLQDWWRSVGLERPDFYITNVYPYRPPGNDLTSISKHDLEPWIDQLHDRLAGLHDPWLIVPTGATALRALTGKASITKHRGSIYAYQDRQGRTVKVIPTIHPAAVFRQVAWDRRCRLDWGRIASDSTFRELRLPEREHFTGPSLADVEAYVLDAERSDHVALDIETPGGQVACIAFATTPAFSFTIPTTKAYWGDRVGRVWELIARLCASPAAKATQNGSYDAFWLAQRGVQLVNWQWDTLAMHHCLDATDSHGLAYMASVDTRQPFWKDMRDPKEGDDAAVSWSGSNETLWHYNGIDAAVTMELALLYQDALVQTGKLGFYQRHYRDLLQPIQGMMQAGIRLDEQQRRRRWAHLFHRCVALQEHLTEVCGMPLHSTVRNKKRDDAGRLPGLSNDKIRHYLYDILKLPRKKDRSTGAITAKETVIRQLMLSFPDKVAVAGHAILDFRRTAKLMEYLDEGKRDEDGRVRCTFKFTTDTGRFASSKSPTGTGRNLQNIDRELRGVFLPEPGMVFVEIDLSQAEDRVVKMLAAAITGNDHFRERARAKPWENDEHKRAASVIFRVPIGSVTKDQRYLGKRTRHATNYDMHGTKMSEELLNDGLTLTADECDKMISALHAADPDIKAWHAATRQQVMNHRCLVNSWGRMLTFDYDRLDDDTYRRAYAFVPQSEVPDLINQWGLVPISQWLASHRSVLHLQGHDSLLLSCPPDEVWPVITFLRSHLERPRRIGGQELTIPVTVKMGTTWGDMIEWVQPPTEDEVRAALAARMVNG